MVWFLRWADICIASMPESCQKSFQTAEWFHSLGFCFPACFSSPNLLALFFHHVGEGVPYQSYPKSRVWPLPGFFLKDLSIYTQRWSFITKKWYFPTKGYARKNTFFFSGYRSFTAVQDWHFVVQCSKNCRLMQLFSNEVYLIHIVCEVWPSLEASPGRIQSVAGRLGQLTATRGINQIIHENEFPFWYWVNYYYYLGSITRVTML